MCPDWIQMREMKRRWFLFGYSSKEATCIMDIFGRLPSDFFQLKHFFYLLMFANTTHVSSDYCTTKMDSEGNHAFLLLWLSRSNSVKKLLKVTVTQFQESAHLYKGKRRFSLPTSCQTPCTQFPVCWHQLFGSACAVRNTKHRDLDVHQWQSRELPLLLLLLFWLLS